MTDIFISYSSKDREWVARLAKGLEAHGYEVWWDPEILPGQHYQDVIQKALHGATCTVAVWTPNSVASDYVRAECLWAFNKRNLISVLGKDTEIPTPFNAIQIADLRQWRGSADDANFQRLLRGIKFVQTGKAVPPSQQPEPPKKFLWLPTLLISAAVLGGSGIYWQSTQIDPVKEESPARQASTVVAAPPVTIDPAQVQAEAERKAKEAQANELAQAKATLEADDESAWPSAVERLIDLAKKGEGEAMYLLGIVYQKGRGADKDIKASCKFYKDSAERDNVKANDLYKQLKEAVDDPKICP
ncbi:TIR domain-containing protein [Thiothrix subterranea]|uniref:toll/interleukin-1 receptor domain-containing protein n=1 Tax=Thiothrix subterranea TaxID=2735563 RepID=UPI00192C1A41|nr:toll/interleukin-1 receptor domain-containing protein [Thiothrix subterranea]QQZ30678.1 TIR domain-containing protein [Thiothrix subterranea]